MSEENVPLLNIDDQYSNTEEISFILENENTSEKNVIVPNVVVRNLNGESHQEISVVDHNIEQEECFEINNVQALLLDLKDRRLEILENGPTLPEGKEAHIFVSYSSNDKAVVLPIIAELERKHSLACILDDRDFQSGYKILENINNSINISAKVLIFLSNNFNQSGYCKHENDLALIASLENGENMIIPVLLEECDVPRSLRTLTYIDVGKQQTRQKIAMEIYQAYNLPDCSNKFLSSFGKTDQGVVNGFHVDISCCRHSKTCHEFGGPSREYIVLNEEVCSGIKSDKIEVSDDLLLDVAHLINNHFEHGTFSSMHECGCPVSVCVFMSIICTALLMAVMCLLSGMLSGQLPTSDAIKNMEKLDVYFPILLFAVLPVTSLIVACMSCCCLSKIRSNGIARLRVELFEKITSKSYTNNVLLSIGENRTRCQSTLFRHLITLLKTDKYKDTENVEEIVAKELVVSLLKRWLTGGLGDLNSLPDAGETRHSVKGGKKCLCQMLEVTLPKPRGITTII